MITKLTQDTSDIMKIKYRKLFDMAYADLKNAEGGSLLTAEDVAKGQFNDISEYLAHAQHYLDMGKAKYLLLPLDENHFEINANTRLIDVPAGFKNCSGVISDNMAETLMFKIDRYFDFVDLSSLNIDIQWMVPGEGNEKQSGVDTIPTGLIDLDTFNPEGKLRFGWPLSTDLTKKAGNIEFSIRFYDKDQESGKVTYILNTLPTTIPIKNGLDINKTEEGVILNNNHIGLFEQFVKNYNGPVSGLPTSVFFSIKDLEKSDQIDPRPTVDNLILEVCAHTADQQELTYKWYKAIDPSANEGRDRELLTIGNENTPYSQAITYIPANLTDEEKVSRPFKKFFYLNPDSELMEIYGAEKSWAEADRPALYYKGNQLIFNKVPAGNTNDAFNNVTGVYFATATNTKGTESIVGESSRLTIYEPVDIAYEKTVPHHDYLDETSDKYKIEARINSDDNDPFITHTWYFKDSATGTYTEATSAQGTKIAPSNPCETAFEAIVPGYYKVESTALLNRKTKSAINYGADGQEIPQECIVYCQPDVPDFEKCVYKTVAKSTLYDEENNKLKDNWSTLLSFDGAASWIKAGEGDPEIVSVSSAQFLCLKIDLKPWSNAFATKDVTYDWYVQFPNEVARRINEDDIGEARIIPNGGSFNSNILLVDWNWQSSEQASQGSAASFYCVVTNKIYEKQKSSTTQTVLGA